MKKFAFAVQVFGLIAMLPIYVILEMNHGTGLAENKNHSDVKEKPAKTIILVSLNSEAKNEKSIPGKIITGSRAPISKNEIIKVLEKTGYKAY